MIYFLTDGEYTKIGFTTQVIQDRMRDLQTGNARPLILLGVIEGGLDVETFLHSVLRELQVGGEWFNLKGKKIPMMTNDEIEGRVSWLTLKLDIVTLLEANPNLSATQVAKELNTPQSKLRTVQRIVKAWKNENS